MNITTAATQLQSSLDMFVHWLTKWRMQLNPNKSQFKIFTLRRTQDLPILKLYGSEIAWLPSDRAVKYLGVYLDRRLTWRTHINKKLNEAYARLMKLYPIINRKSSLKTDYTLLLYKSILRPLLLYACPIWGNAPNTIIQCLQIFQNKVLRISVNAPWFIRNTQLHKELGIQNIQDYIRNLATNFFGKLHQVSGAQHYSLGQKHCISSRLKSRLPQDKFL